MAVVKKYHHRLTHGTIKPTRKYGRQLSNFESDRIKTPPHTLADSISADILLASRPVYHQTSNRESIRKVKTYPTKTAENGHLLGSWKSPGLEYRIHRRKRAQWHKAKKQGKLGEQIDSKYWNQCSRQTSKKAAARMKASLKIQQNNSKLKPIVWSPIDQY